ncbi:aminoimidazole riboside kinase [compost metagenome]
MQQLVPSISVDSVDSTGAGDAFIGALLQQLIQQDCRLDDQQQFLRAVHWANIYGALTCTHFGAIDAIPTAAEVDAYLKDSKA